MPLVGAVGFALLMGACGANSGTDAEDPSGGSTGVGGSVDGGGGSTPSSGGSASAGGSNGSGGANSSTGGGTGSGGLPALEECATPSIDRLQSWQASGEGPTTPATGDLLVADGAEYVARISYNGASEWHVGPVVWIANVFDGDADFSASSGVELTYSATADFFLQIRPSSDWDGGDKWHANVPSTNGAVQTLFIPFQSTSWFEKLGAPPVAFDVALTEARGFVFVGNTQNTIEIRGLRVDGYEPPCL